MKPPVRILPVVLSFLVASYALAQHQTFNVNPSASQCAFTLGASDHGVKGTFHVDSGVVDFDRAASTISGSIVVGAASGETGNNGRDKKMKNDVLNVAQYAQVTFQPKSYTGALASSGDSNLQVSGVFTLHGTPHDITVPMQVHIDGANLTAKTHFTVPYVEWGLKDPSIMFLKVAKQVDIDLTLTGKVSPAS